jgi:hypothetical protein
MQTEKCRKEWFYDGVPLKFKGKTGRPSVYQHGLFELIIDPS